MIVPVSVSGSTFTASGRFPFTAGQQVSIDSHIPNQIPAPLTEFASDGTRVFYYLVNVSGNSFQVAATSGGDPITLTTAGTGQISVSEYPPFTWDQLGALPLVQASDVRGIFTTPEALGQLSAAPNNPIGVTLSSSTFTTGIDSSFIDWTPVRFATSGTLPSGLSSNTTYYTRDGAGNSFAVASVIGGSALTVSGGTGQLTVSNYALDAVLVDKLALVHSRFLYNALLAMVANHMKSVSRAWWWWYAPATTPTDVMFYPTINKAQIVLDNLKNPEKLIDAYIDFTAWLMAKDGRWRNEIKDQSFFAQFDQVSESAREAAAQKSLAALAQLLMVSGYQGAHRVFDFGEVTDTISISLI